MQSRIVQKWNFYSEVLPPLVVGVLCDLIGRYVCTNLLKRSRLAVNREVGGDEHGFLAMFADQIFLDMAGTAYVSIMLGPWWAATVGVVAQAVNGGFYNTYFPFGVVNILGGLAWGYFAEARNIRARLAEGTPKLIELVRLYIAMTMIGAVV